MSRWKTTLALLIITVGIGAYISLYELRQPTPEEREHRSKEVLSLKLEQITQLVLDLPQAKATLTRDAATWRIEPQKVRADSELTDRILEECAPLMAERILSPTSERPLDLKAYGLEPAVGWLSFATKTTSVTLLIGEATAVGNNRYAKVSDRPEVFIIPPTLFEMANVPAATLRDAQLLPLEAWLVDELTIRSAHGTLALTRKDNDWQLTQPMTDRAERSAVNALLDRLGKMQIERFVDDAPTVEQVSQWGLDHPNAEVTLAQSEPSASLTLFVGTNLRDDATLLYAKRSDELPLYAIPAADVTALMPDPTDLRLKACFEFFATAVEKLDIATQGAGVTLERKDGAWKETRSGSALKAQRAEALLNTLADLRLTGFVEDAPPDLARYGLLAPAGVISLWTNEHQDPQRLLIGSAVEATPERYGRIEGRSAIVKLPGLVTALLATTLDQLRPDEHQPAGSHDPLPDGGVDEHRQDQQRPPEEVMPQRP